MSSGRFDRLRHTMLELVALSPDARSGFLRRLHADDPVLADAARTLLSHDAGEAALDPLGESSGRAGDALPTHLGTYPIIRKIGAGGMGIVYAATDPTLGRGVAIKVLPSALADHEPALAAFREEARLLARLNHPNIATIYSLERDGPDTFLTMELLPGDPLSTRLSQGRLDLDDTLSLARQISGALEAAHERGIIHRDLKPSNIILTPDHGAKVLDFGLAKLVGEGGVTETVAPGPSVPSPSSGSRPWTGPMGTPGYMSPEQIEGQATDQRTDVWSFGCVLYECLAGQRVFPGPTRERVRATLHEEPDYDRIPDTTPPSLVHLLRQCLEKDPSRRLPSIERARRMVESVVESRNIDRIRARMAAESPRPGDERSGYLPRYMTRFFGRQAEIEALGRMVTEHQLITLTGLGGAGKTRLAREVAAAVRDRFPDGTWFVDLTAVPTCERVPQTVMVALRLPEGNDGPLATLMERLRDSARLIVLDNCEHVIPGCVDLVQTVLPMCPALRILATSREPLGVEGEAAYPVPPLPLPPDPDSPNAESPENAVVALFLDRAATAAPHVAMSPRAGPEIVALCRKLEGLPLAVELAAACMRTLRPAEILERLDDRFRILRHSGGPAPERHESLRAVLDWSYERLSGAERALLGRLAIFAGGWTLEAAEAVCVGDEVAPWQILELTGQLISQSLIERQTPDTDRSPRSRFRMLETVREYALDRLTQDGEVGVLRRRHFDYYRELASTMRLHGPEQQDWIARFREEEENVRAALDYSSSADMPMADAAELPLKMCGYWVRVGRWQEGRRHYERLNNAVTASETADVSLVIRVARAFGELTVHQGDLDAGRGQLERALDMAREIDDPLHIGGILNTLANLEKLGGNLEQAIRRYGECLEIYERLRDDWSFSGVLFNRGVASAMRGDHARAEADFRRSLEMKRAIGDKRGIAHALNGLGYLKTEQGEYEDSREMLEESLAIKRELADDPGVVSSLLNLGFLSVDQIGDPTTDTQRLTYGRQCFREGLTLAERLGDRPHVAKLLFGLGTVDWLGGDLVGSRRSFEQSLAIGKETKIPAQQGWALAGLSMVAIDEKAYGSAWTLGSEAIRMFEAAGISPVGDLMDTLVAAQIGFGRPREAALLLGHADKLREDAANVPLAWRQHRLDELRRKLLSSLGESGYEEAAATGRQTTLPDLLAMRAD